jgi:hypothetical protein
MTEHANDGYNDPVSATGRGPRNASALVDEAAARAAQESSGSGSDEPTLKDLQQEAADLEIEGRSSMNKDDLERAIAKAKK